VTGVDDGENAGAQVEAAEPTASVMLRCSWSRATL
jgi:hypothetical protein